MEKSSLICLFGVRSSLGLGLISWGVKEMELGPLGKERETKRLARLGPLGRLPENEAISIFSGKITKRLAIWFF